MNYEYYRIFIVEGAEHLETIKRFEAEYKVVSENRDKWVKSRDGDSAVVLGECVVGIIKKDGAEPLGDWRKQNNRDWPDDSFVPNSRSKGGKRIAEEMKGLTIKSTSDLAALLGFNGFCTTPNGNGQLELLRSHCYIESSTYLVLHPKIDKEPIPAGFREIKLSEFYALKEKSEKAA